MVWNDGMAKWLHDGMTWLLVNLQASVNDYYKLSSSVSFLRFMSSPKLCRPRCICALKVVAPIRADCFLATNVPHVPRLYDVAIWKMHPESLLLVVQVSMSKSKMKTKNMKSWRAWKPITKASKLQLKAILHDAFDVEALCRHGMGDVFWGQGLQDGGLTCIVQTQDKDSGFRIILQRTSKHHM